MEMTFWTGYKGLQILFNSWETDNPTQYAFSCIAAMAFVVFHNFLKWVARRLDAYLTKKFDDCCATSLINGTRKTNKLTIPWYWEMVRAFLHMIQFTISYFIMLIAMTYNVGIFVSVMAGAFIGYFLFMRMSQSEGIKDTSALDGDCCS
eukprot:m.98016 g.98016  ORF g.98016 m.98016 type:complete len:149 (+) comp13115_c0_seq7:223-669(+)